MTAPKTFAVIVPTTGAALTLLKLSPRPGLPHGAAFAAGDYRPLHLSSDYRALAGPEGPIARHLGAAIPPHELRLSAAPDGGRSWEAPIAIAHLLLAKGWTLTDTPQTADLTIWATGAVDLDLHLIPGDYALDRKTAVTAPAQTRTIAILPPGAGQDTAAAALQTLGAETHRTDAQTDLASLVQSFATSQTPKPKPPLKTLAATALAAIAIIAYTQLPTPEPIQDIPLEIAEDPPTPITQTPVENVPTPPSTTLAMVHATAAGSCRGALFDPAQRDIRPVPWTDQGFAPTPYDPTLCGILLTGPAIPQIETTPPDAFVTADSAAGTQLLFLRTGTQNVVYGAPEGDDGTGQSPLRHEIINP